MTILLMIALLLYMVGAFYSIIIFSTKSKHPGRGLIALVGAGFIAHTAAIGFDWWRLSHFPIVNPKEVSSFIAWAIVAYFLVMSLRYHVRALPTFILPLVFVFTLISLLLPEPGQLLPLMLEGAITVNEITQIIFPVHVTL